MRRRIRWCTLLMGWAVSGAALAQAAPLELRQARAIVTVDDVTTEADVVLPYNWDSRHKGRTGTAIFELRFARPATEAHTPSAQPEPANPTTPWGLYLPRVGNTAEIWLNGVLLERMGDPGIQGYYNYAKGPQYVTVPPQLLAADNVLRIAIRTDSGRRGGLAAPLMGPRDQVWPLYRANRIMRVDISAVIAVFSLLVGGLALALWFTQREPAGGALEGRDSLYLAAALAEFCWALRVGDVILERSPLPWPIWAVVLTAVYAGWMCGVGWFCHSIAGWNRTRTAPWSLAVLWTFFGSAVLCAALSQALQQPVWLSAWLGAANLLFTVYALVYLWQALRHHDDRIRLSVALVGTLNVAIGIRDWVAVRLAGSGLEVHSWMRYSAVLFGLALAAVVVLRFRSASARAHDLAAHLTERVNQKERQLAASYARMEQIAREQASSAERNRILRDMHDGVGSHLSSAIRQLQSGSNDREEVLRTLRDSLDQLKLSIDAMHLEPGDVTTLLANLRYRLEPRLNGAGITLAWEVDELPALPRLDTEAMRQLQFMLFEIISNVLQHAQASTLRIAARARDGGGGNEGGVQLTLSDNGSGFDTSRPPRKGLLSLHERAQAIGAGLELRSSAGGAEVEISL